jgi:aryl sulfotransferase
VADTSWPGVEPRLYRHPLLDSRRWSAFTPRCDDIVISTSMKAGTTWMQTIVAELLWPDGEAPGPVNELSPWVEVPVLPAGMLTDLLEGQEHRRFVKSHVPPSGLPRCEGWRYIVVCRDGRDVLMSLANHHRRLSRDVLRLANDLAAADPDRNGELMPVDDLEDQDLFGGWLSRGSFPWQEDGWPYWSHLSHLAEWWPLRHRPEVLFVHFDDLLGDLAGQMRRIAAFLEIDVPEPRWTDVVRRATFEEMRERADEVVPVAGVFEGGGRGFLHSGTNGRWRSVLSDAERAAYDRRVQAVLPPDAAAWMAGGGALEP